MNLWNKQNAWAVTSSKARSGPGQRGSGSLGSGNWWERSEIITWLEVRSEFYTPKL